MTERYCEGERFADLSFTEEAFEDCDFTDCVFADCSFTKCELFYPQIGVKPCSMAGGGVSKNIWNCFRTAPEGTGQPLTCSTSGMGLRLK